MPPPTAASIEIAISRLGQTLADVSAPEWRWRLRGRLSEVREALTAPAAHDGEAWLAARELSSNRHRRQLQARVGVLAAGVLDRLDADHVLVELQRLHADLERYVQRLHDLVYDSVALEIGGSE